MPFKISKLLKQVSVRLRCQTNVVIYSTLYFVHYTAPTAPPDSFSIVSIGSRNVVLSWTLPNEDGRNGMIASYTATCNDSDGVLVNTSTTVGLTTMFEGLCPYSFYSCSVVATTSGGDGPPAILNFTTASDSKT